MSGNDLYALVASYTKYKAKSDALNDALISERKAHENYVAEVSETFNAFIEERKIYQKALKDLERQIYSPSIELYGGYNTESQWEGGLRLVIRLK